MPGETSAPSRAVGSAQRRIPAANPGIRHEPTPPFLTEASLVEFRGRTGLRGPRQTAPPAGAETFSPFQGRKARTAGGQLRRRGGGEEFPLEAALKVVVASGHVTQFSRSSEVDAGQERGEQMKKCAAAAAVALLLVVFSEA